MKNNNYIIADSVSKVAVIVDPAWEQVLLENHFRQLGLNLVGILITHSHFYHINLAGSMASKHDCPIWMSSNEIAVSCFQSEHLVSIDETKWSVGNIIIESILIPGYTEGCVSFLIDSWLFCWDVLFNEGVGICPSNDDAFAMYESLQKLNHRLKHDTQVFLRHTHVKSPEQAFAYIQRVNIYLQFNSAKDFVAFRMRNTQNLSKILNFK
ncbi:MBL fold metallo-hydrolase [Teredinibacter haidensis]|uniref:MBL fold metallo-hydrolase n=1 Tax=Teredinibacter haidensis TaxID=2731755 RepID=UPI000AD28A0B|nr:MBL fold metallo-hydrolase [Teredinibacter haidensis]